jgi:Tol biopolymer transport system component
MARVRRLAQLAAVSVLVFFIGPGSLDASAQQFGRNKVEYVDFDFKVLDTEHFAVYYYSSEETSARLAARLAERWYARLSRVLGHDLRGRQPLILYGSQPEFAQTNVVSGLLGEGVGGVTESARRRIVLPFAPTLAETDRILGHEIAHAFQFDMARGYGGLTMWPLWAVEGMAQYLSVGAGDHEAAMWLRDAIRFDLLPKRASQAARAFSPYRYGSAMWAYIAGRFGDRVMGEILTAKGGGTLERRIRRVTGIELEQLFADWRAAAYATGSPQPAADPDNGPSPLRPGDPSPLLLGAKAGKVQLGPALSPSGRDAIFFSERDRLSLDLFLADTTTGAITRKLATTTATARFESLQAIRSAGSWNPSGDQFVFAAIAQGQPALVILDVSGSGRDRQIKLPQLGQVLTPAWSPDGRRIALSALKAGATDLYVYDLDRGTLRQLTSDHFSDLQPVWSPDGRELSFATDRYSTDLALLTFGPSQLAVIDISSGAIRALPAIEAAKHVNPQWSGDGRSLYFISDPGGISNVYRLDLTSGGIYQISSAPGGVVGLSSTSPALSVARDTPAMIFTAYRRGTYALEIHRGAPYLAGLTDRRIDDNPSPASVGLPPVERPEGEVAAVLKPGFGLTDAEMPEARAYPANLSLESIGQPYLSSGGGPFGTFVRGGGSLLFGDMLGERKLGVAVQFGNHLRDVGLAMQYLNRERRWNWGAVAELQPSIRALPRQRLLEHDGHAAVSLETHYFEQMQLHLGGLVAYPLSRAQRFEFGAGVRHIRYRQTVQSGVRSLQNGRLLERTTTTGFGGAPANVGEISAAFVGDTALFGATSPIVGTRYRFEMTSALGNLSSVRVLLDHRQYAMPAKPYTIATRIVHVGQYGPDVEDPRLQPAFLGSRQFVHGYGWSSLRCDPTAGGECHALGELLGNRLLAGNLELRFPVMGVLSREIRYGPVPVDGFLFSDNGLVWSRSMQNPGVPGGRSFVSSFGAGVRVNAFGFPVEFAAVRALRAPARGWSFDFSLRTGF